MDTRVVLSIPSCVKYIVIVEYKELTFLAKYGLEIFFFFSFFFTRYRKKINIQYTHISA